MRHPAITLPVCKPGAAQYRHYKLRAEALSGNLPVLFIASTILKSSAPHPVFQLLIRFRTADVPHRHVAIDVDELSQTRDCARIVSCFEGDLLI